MKKIHIALAGNPNAGKSTIFNALTGDNQHTGNWPGKTVEMKTGRFSLQGQQVEIIDLPGTYSLSSYTPEEKIARDYLVENPIDMVINVVDASNLERNLYLTLQVLETGLPTLLMLNMSDVARRRGLEIDIQKLSKELGGIPIVVTAASKNQGLQELRETIVSTVPPKAGCIIDYPKAIETEISALEDLIRTDEKLVERYPARWLALELLEGDRSLLNGRNGQQAIFLALANSEEKLAGAFQDGVDIAIADTRYQFIQKLTRRILTRTIKTDSRTDRIDQIVTNRWLGVPIFLVLMFLVFNLVQNVSAPYLDWIDSLFGGPFTRWALALLGWVQAPDWMASLVVEGIMAGVGGVLVFVPGLFVMYLLLAVMEQSGYMARAAFVMDKLMSRIGLHGKSFIPMVLGFGCNVPAIYATRTIKKPQARILTALLIPFMSCSARLPVYLIFGLAFFPQHANMVIFSLYILGVLVAAAVGLAASRLLFKGETLSILVMELPGYRMPTVKSLLTYARRQSGEFVKKAGTIIVVFSTLLWLLLNFPWGVEDARNSAYGQLSSAISPVLAPAGFGTWEASGSLVTGLIAKEVVVSTLSQIYHLPADEESLHDHTFTEDLVEIGRGFGEATLTAGQEVLEMLTPGIALFPEETEPENTALSEALRASFTPLSAYSFLVFVLLYVPCVATIGAQKQEFGYKWAGVSIVITLVVPWVLSVMVYQGGLLLGLG